MAERTRGAAKKAAPARRAAAKKPATGQPAAKKPPSARRARAAAAETRPTERTAEYRGVVFSVPDPGEWSSELYFMLGELQGGDKSLGLLTRLVTELIGAEQFEVFRAKLRADGVTFNDTPDAIQELCAAVFTTYGTTMGESEASAGSSSNAGT